MTRLTTAILARNEAGPDRYLARVIARCKSFSDDIVLLDDASTDETAALAESLGCHVARKTSGDGFWGVGETPLRKTLWELGARVAGDGWLLIADADMLLEGDVRALCASWDVNAWAFPLCDMWSETHFRIDGYWQGHTHPRPWLFCPSRVPADWTPQWPERTIHTGHAPSNFPIVAGIAPPDVYWRHMAYATPEARRRKHAQYLAHRARLTPWETAHAESIRDGE